MKFILLGLVSAQLNNNLPFNYEHEQINHEIDAENIEDAKEKGLEYLRSLNDPLITREDVLNASLFGQIYPLGTPATVSLILKKP